MKYAKANRILPEYIIALIQEYADGCYLYIPRKVHKARKWGEVCGSRGKISLRNKEIYLQFTNGIKVPDLAKQYFLSERTIQNIISDVKSKQHK